jgi:hypothetical protein
MVTWEKAQKLGRRRTCPAQGSSVARDDAAPSANTYRNSTSAVTGEGPVGKASPPPQAAEAASRSEAIEILFTLSV